MSQVLHAGLIALHLPGGWRGVLLQGPSGAGKSDLAIRAAAEGFRLVADDRVLVWASGGVLYGRAPDAIAGKLEVRGLDVVAEPALGFCRIVLAARDGTPERIPDPVFETYEGLSLPSVTLPLLEASAPARLRRALQHLGGRAEGAYLSHLAAGQTPQPGGDSR